MICVAGSSMGAALVSLYYSSDQDLFEFPAVLTGCIIVLGLNHPIHGEHSLISEQCQQLTNTIYMQVSNVSHCQNQGHNPARTMNRDCLVYLVHALVGCRAVLKSQS
jgi:hypothetical protein